MHLFLDVHEGLPETATVADVAHAHQADLANQDEYGVKYLKYWVDEKQHKAFCLVRRTTPRRRRVFIARRTG
jgi:hypothetical protein